MGGEGHMLDMIKKMKMNREQLKNTRENYSHVRKPRISIEDYKEIDELGKVNKLSPIQKKRYQTWAILLFVFLLVVFGVLLVIIF